MRMRTCSFVLLLLSMVVLVVAVVENGSGGRKGPTCLSVVKPLKPCTEYIEGKSKAPHSKCCSAVKRLGKYAKSGKAKRFICGCIKKSLHSVKHVKPKLILTIPKKCHIKTNLPPVTPTYNCSRIKGHSEELVY